MADIPTDLFKRIADRANDPMRRTYMAGAMANAQPLDFASLLGDLQKHGAPGAQGLAGALGGLTNLMGGMPNMNMLGPSGMASTQANGPLPIAPPPSDEELDRAISVLGQSLPAEVRQLYAIGDGGFGPGEGLFSLADLLHRYRELTKEPYGPAGQNWPASLLPLFDEDPVLVCIDAETGAIVAWDPEEIEDEGNDGDWQRSFKPEAPDLATFMANWVDRPTFEDERSGRSFG